MGVFHKEVLFFDGGNIAGTKKQNENRCRLRAATVDIRNTVRLVERFSPLMKGDSVCGSKQQGIVKLFFQAEAPFLLVLQKKWGCIYIKAERSSLFLTVKRADSIRPYIFICSFWCKKSQVCKNCRQKTATLPCEMLLFGCLFFYQSLMFLNLFITSPETIPITTPVAVPVMMSTGR